MPTPLDEIQSLNDDAWRKRDQETSLALTLAQKAASLASFHGEHLQYLFALRTESHCAYLLADYDRASTLAEELLHLAEEQRDDMLTAFALNTLGNSHLRCGRYNESLSYLFRTLGLRLHAKDKHGEAAVLNNIGNVYYHLSDYKSARDYYQRSLDLKKELGDKKGEANSYTNLGMVHHLISDYQKAIQSHQNAIVLYNELAELRGLSHALNNLGNVQRDVGEYNAALETHFKCLSLKRDLLDKHGEALALLNLGRTCEKQGDLVRATDYFAKSKSLAIELGDKQTELYVLERNAAIAELKGDYDEAVSTLLRALALSESLGARSDTLSCFHQIGKLQRLASQFTSALEYHRKALLLAQELSEKENETDILREIGTVYFAMGDAVSATKYLFQSLELAERLENRALIADALCAIGDIAELLGDTERAEACYTKSLDLYNAIGHRLHYTQTSYRLGLLLLSQKKISEADTLFTNALKEAERLGAKLLQSDLWNARAEVAKSEADFERHLKFQRTAALLKNDVINAPTLLRMKSLLEARETTHLSQSLSTLHASAFQSLFQKAQERASEKLIEQRPTVSLALPLQSHQVVIQTFGTFRISIDGRDIPNEVWKRKKSRDVFKFLLVHYKQSVSVDTILDALWGSCSESHKNLLLTAISHVRKAIEPTKTPLFLQSVDKSYRLDFGDGAMIDFVLFQSHIKSAKASRGETAQSHYEQAAALYKGTFLAEDEAEEWTTFLRESLSDAHLSVLIALAHAALASNQLDLALDYGKTLVGIDRTLETGYDIQFQVFQKRGQVSDAQKLYAQCREAFKKELGVAPPMRFQKFLNE